ncbi:hypothetical protein BDN71DRAFT_576037 [Pleurotus eryngii]|uniref:Uncharacterized protein n=1 Tax=Pleurotus eryngii TaxID=5323 RepID=A0A9P5ZIT4_PLEER|nr:hypothetical protein BDN71DRAFT_576037 [Pleurotus eryngii]
MTSTFGGTVTDGIQDVTALFPLLGTEQCEEHVGSALPGHRPRWGEGPHGLHPHQDVHGRKIAARRGVCAGWEGAVTDYVGWRVPCC